MSKISIQNSVGRGRGTSASVAATGFKLALAFLFSCSTLFAGHPGGGGTGTGINVTFTFYRADSGVDTNVNCTLTPTAINTNGIGALITLTPLAASVSPSNSILDYWGATVGSNAVFTMSNLYGGTYLVQNNANRFYINVPTNAGNYSADALLSGVTIPGANAVFTRAQSDGRYILTTNSLTLFGLTVSNATLLGNIRAATLYAGTMTGTNLYTTNDLFALGNLWADFATVTNLTALNAAVSNALLAYALTITNSFDMRGSATMGTVTVTNLNALNYPVQPAAIAETNAFLHWAANLVTYQTLDVPLASVLPNTNAIWEVTVTGASNVMAACTNCSFWAWVTATNTIRVEGSSHNAGAPSIAIPDGYWRIIARQYTN